MSPPYNLLQQNPVLVPDCTIPVEAYVLSLAPKAIMLMKNRAAKQITSLSKASKNDHEQGDFEKASGNQARENSDG